MKQASNFIKSIKNRCSKPFFEILCYGKPPNWFIWHSTCKSRHHYLSENVCRIDVRKVCLNYKFCTMCIEWGTYFSKKVPNFEIVWPTPTTPRALTVRGVYEVRHSCYEQLYKPVCFVFYELSKNPEFGRTLVTKDFSGEHVRLKLELA